MLKLLFYDIEILQHTLGDSWKTMGADHSFIISFGYQWGLTGKPQVIDLLTTGEFNKIHPLKRGGDKKLIQEIHKIMSEADLLVGHYSDKFDWKYMCAKFAQAGLPDIIHIDKLDTCITARKYFKVSSKRLGSLCNFFGIATKQSIDYGNWFACYCHDPRAIKRISTYCKFDVVALVGLYKKLSGFFTVKQHAGVVLGHDKCSCQYCGSENTRKHKPRATAKGSIQIQLQCNDCHKYTTVSNSVYLRERGV